MKQDDIILYTSMASVLLPIAIGFTPHRRHHSYVRILLSGLIISALTDFSNVIYFTPIRSTALLLHAYTVLEFCILSLLYQQLFHGRHIKRNINFIILLFLVFKIFDVMFITSLQEADNLAMTIEAVVMISYGLLYFNQVLREMSIPNLEKYPVFWINSAILIYFSGSLFLFLFSHFIFSSQIFYETFWTIHTILIFIKNILFSVGLWLQK